MSWNGSFVTTGAVERVRRWRESVAPLVRRLTSSAHLSTARARDRFQGGTVARPEGRHWLPRVGLHRSGARSRRQKADPHPEVPDSRRPRSEEDDPNLPVRLLRSCQSPGTISFRFCVREAAARDHQDPAKSGRWWPPAILHPTREQDANRCAPQSSGARSLSIDASSIQGCTKLGLFLRTRGSQMAIMLASRAVCPQGARPCWTCPRRLAMPPRSVPAPGRVSCRTPP